MFRAAFPPIIRRSLPNIGIGTFYAVMMTVCSILLLVANGHYNYRLQHPAPGSKWSLQLHKMYQCRCTAKNSWWWVERLPEICTVVIPINLEFSASVGFIHKESHS